MKNVILAFAVSAMSFSPAFGNGPRRVIGSGTGTAGTMTNPKVISWSWEDTSITDTVVTPWSEGSNTCVYVLQSTYAKQLKLNVSSALPDVPVELDNEFSIRASATSSKTYTFPQMTVKTDSAGLLQSTYSTATFNGGYTIEPGASLPLTVWNTGNGEKTANITFINSSASYLAGDADAVVSYGYTVNTDNVDPANGMTVDSTLTIGIGDASAFEGKYVISDPTKDKVWTNLVNNGYSVRAHLKFVSATAFGDPTATKADAVTLNEGAYLSLGANVEQYATRGVTIAADKKGGVEAADNTTWALTAPVTCESGATFAKVGEGTVTLDGDCTGVSAIEVTEGTLVLGAFGSFANGLAVTVKPGATLVQNKHVGNIAVTCEEGGTYTQDIQYVVPYSDATGASTPLDFTAAMPELPLSIRLTESVEIASFANNGWTAKRIDVARLPSDTTATAEDFNDGTLKTYGLPKTSFEIEARDGYKALVLVAKPVVWNIEPRVGVGDFIDGVNYGLNGTNGQWSLPGSAQQGYDYLATNYVQGTGKYTTDAPPFHGDSLTIVGQNMALTSGNVDIGNAFFYGNVETYYNAGNLGGTNSRKPWTGITRGTATIAEGATLTIQTRQPKDASTDIRTNHLDVAVFGEGNLKLTSGKLKNNDPYYFIPGGAPVYLGGDNSGFSGKMIVTCYGSDPSESDGTTLHLGQASSFGGTMPAATADGLLLEKYGFLYPEQTMTLNAANRGIKIVSGGFDVPEGVALTVSVPLAINGAAVKKGAGELALGGATTFASGSFTVKEGAVRALSDDAVAGDFAFADGTTIVQDPEATLVNGFTGAFSVVGEGTPKVHVSLDRSHSHSDVYTIPVCTVSSSAADLTDSIELAAVRGYTSRLVKEDVIVGGEDRVRYSAGWRRLGLVVSFR